MIQTGFRGVSCLALANLHIVAKAYQNSDSNVATTTSPPTNDHLRKLQWENQGGNLIGNDGRCLYMRETAGSLISGFIFGTVISAGGIGCGIWTLTKEKGGDAIGFGIFALVIGLLFLLLMIVTIRRGRVLIIYDSESREIRWLKHALSADKIYCMTTQSFSSKSGVSYMVAAQLHDGKYVTIGPTGHSTWPMHWAKQGADWLGLPYR